MKKGRLQSGESVGVFVEDDRWRRAAEDTLVAGVLVRGEAVNSRATVGVYSPYEES